MNIKVDNKQKLTIKVGDIIEYESTERPSQYSKATKRSHPFYMVCHCKEDGYFVMSLTGGKDRLRFYRTLELLLESQNRVANIYSQDEWEMRLFNK